jgi:choline kinase
VRFDFARLNTPRLAEGDSFRKFLRTGDSMKAVILAAGIGSRLNANKPKCLTVLPDGETILDKQVKILRGLKIREIVIVVGYKKEMIMDAFPDLLFVFNPRYRSTNTSKSLLAGMRAVSAEDIIWMNGDVCLEEAVIKRVMQASGNAIAVNKEKCGKEEVKYATNARGAITGISKTVGNAEGEAVGINKIAKKDLPLFLNCLDQCENNDYFEKAIELCIGEKRAFYPVDISDCRCIEVDFREDLKAARQLFM